MALSHKATLKNILITGAGHGIGYAIANSVYPRAKNLILITKSSNSLCKLDGKFPKAMNYQIDLSHEDEITEFVQNISTDLNKLDVLVNNAGFYVGKKIEDTTIYEFDELYKIHMRVPYFLIQNLLPLLKKSDCPQVINISSAANFLRIPGESAYTATKSGLTAMSDVLRNELQKHRIRFTTIHPYAVNTSDNKKSNNQLSPKSVAEIVAHVIATHPNCQILNVELSSVSDWRGNWPPWIKI